MKVEFHRNAAFDEKQWLLVGWAADGVEHCGDDHVADPAHDPFGCNRLCFGVVADQLVEERLSLDVFAALCDILGCTPTDLIEIRAVEHQAQRTGTGTDETIGDVTAIRAGIRPKRARIT